MQQSYSKVFYDWQRTGSHKSAEAILPIVFDAVHPKTVVDVGCGVGPWLDVARNLGASVVGYEGEWVKSLEPAYPGLEIRTADLEQPLKVDQTFDLAMTVEVAEHLSPGRADSFVADLVALAPCRGRAAITTSTSSGRATGPIASPNMAMAPAISSARPSGTIAESLTGTART